MEPCNICGEPADGGLHTDASVCAEYLRQRVAELEEAIKTLVEYDPQWGPMVSTKREAVLGAARLVYPLGRR